MTAPDLPTGWNVTLDGDGKPAGLWHGVLPALRYCDLPELYRDQLWSVLTAVLAPDEATVCEIERRLNASFWLTNHELVENVLAALADTVAEVAS